MRPRLFTARNTALFIVAVCIFGGLAYWLSIGAPLPFGRVPSTAGKIAFLSDRDGHRHIWMMDGKDGANAVALTSGSIDDSAPDWNPAGSEIAFVTQKAAGATPQVYRVDARLGASAVPVTNTSATKEQPRYGAESRIFYLASGKVAATNPATQDTDQIFPEADATRTAAPLLGTGGIAYAEASRDGSRLALALRLEQGQALLLYDIKAGACALIGAASERVLFHFLPDNRLLALFEDGSPLPQPGLIFDQNAVKSGASAPPLSLSVGDAGMDLGIGTEGDSEHYQAFPLPKARIAVIYDTGGTPQPLTRLPFKPNALAVAPDGSIAACTTDVPVEAPQGGGATIPAGVFLFPLSGATSPAKPLLFNQPSSEPSFSADGKQIVFVSGKDVYVVPTDGSAPATNLTKGQGANSAPVCSPAKSEGK